MAVSEPTLLRFGLALLVAAFILTAHVEHMGVLHLTTRIGAAPDESDIPRPGLLSKIRGAVVGEIETAHTLCNESSRGLFVPEPQLASAYPWHLIPYIMSWRWLWNGAYGFANALLVIMPMFNFWHVPTADINNCMLKNVDAMILLYCYKYMLTAVIQWRKKGVPPFETLPAEAAKTAALAAVTQQKVAAAPVQNERGRKHKKHK